MFQVGQQLRAAQRAIRIISSVSNRQVVNSMCVVRGPTFSSSSGELRLTAVDWPVSPVSRGYGQLDIPKGKAGPPSAGSALTASWSERSTYCTLCRCCLDSLGVSCVPPKPARPFGRSTSRRLSFHRRAIERDRGNERRALKRGAPFKIMMARR
jgi:hypothetical protein